MKKEIFVMIVALALVISLVSVYAVGGNGNGSQGGDNGSIMSGNETGGNGNNTWQNKTMDKNRTRTNNTFVPWQQRNESICPERCRCQGAVVSCATDNGKIMNITAGNSGNVITLVMEKTKVNTALELERENNGEENISRIRARLSNGKNTEIKIMPDVASERALERLRLKVCNESNNCTIVLKEVPNKNNMTHNGTIAYEMQVQRHVRVLGLFQAKVQERAEVNAENGEVKTFGPWWMFLATKE